MKRIIKILKCFSLNLFWILMFICLYPVENFHLIRFSASFLAAAILAIFQVVFEEKVE
jgi:hypothetical protein